MAQNEDWFPGKEADVLKLIKVWEPMLASNTNRTDYSWPVQACTKTQVAMEKFKTAVQDYEDNDSSKNEKIKQDAAKQNEAAIRAFATSHLRVNEDIPDYIKEIMGVHVRDGVSTSQDDPTERVEFELSTDKGEHSVSAVFRRPGAKKPGKGHYHAVEGRYWLRPLDAPAPKDPEEEGGNSIAVTANPWKRRVGGEHRGEVFYMSMRWENDSTGKQDGNAGKGPWSVIQSIIVQ
jgi:hypothetical protein